MDLNKIKIFDFPILSRTKLASPLEPSSSNPGARIYRPDNQITYIDLADPEEAVLSLYRHFPVINISNWWQTLQDAVLKTQKACLQHNIDPQRLVFFP